jgi:hypothetical protein
LGAIAYAKAEPLMACAAEIQEAQFHLELPRLSEPRKRALMMILQKQTDRVTSLHAESMPSIQLTPATALRQAKLRLLRQPQFVHPYYWVAFIPAGDWTSLDPYVLKR